MDREQIFSQLRSQMVELFELEPDDVRPEAHLVEDLGLDSIDAIELSVKLQELTGRRVGEEALKSVATVEDVVALVESELSRSSAELPGDSH
ncbi:MAG: acyl carrier protein [Myxococcales bacterium]|nr:acyl carrier protein [Myxococcales bacterium]